MNGLKQLRQSETKESFIQYFWGIPPFFKGFSEFLRLMSFFFFLDRLMLLLGVSDAGKTVRGMLVLNMDLAPLRRADDCVLDEMLGTIEFRRELV